MISKLQTFIIECKRVLQVTKKPDKKEFTAIVKVSGLGIILIGTIGFLLLILREMMV